jgi:hypothetical protein
VSLRRAFGFFGAAIFDVTLCIAFFFSLMLGRSRGVEENHSPLEAEEIQTYYLYYAACSPRATTAPDDVGCSGDTEVDF